MNYKVEQGGFDLAVPGCPYREITRKAPNFEQGANIIFLNKRIQIMDERVLGSYLKGQAGFAFPIVEPELAISKLGGTHGVFIKFFTAI